MLLVKNILTKKTQKNQKTSKTKLFTEAGLGIRMAVTKTQATALRHSGNCADTPKQVKLCPSPTQERLLTLILPCKVHSFCLSTLPRYLRQALIFDRKLQVFELTHTRKGEKHQNLLHFPFSLFHSPLFHVLLFNT